MDKNKKQDSRTVEDNQAEASRQQAGSSGKYGTEFASTDNKVTRKIEP
ncbi:MULTISPECIES: hypothetical protein [unclassified Bacillus (in: firmicutes)]|nr:MULTISPECIES: hypothetical protein [unclassified Bacillus (in: firmicutes)]